MSIWICPTTAAFKKNSIIDVRALGTCIAGKVKIPEDDVNLFQVVILSLNDENEQSEQKIIQLLSVLLSGIDSPEEKKKILRDEFEIPMDEEFEREVETVCNLSQAVKIRTENEVNQRLAKDMLKDGEKLNKIVKYSRLTEEAVRKLASDMGVAVVL